MSVGEGDGSVFSVRWIGCCCWCLNGKGLYVSDLNLTEPLTYYFLQHLQSTPVQIM